MDQQISLLQTLVHIAEALAESRAAQIRNETIRHLIESVRLERARVDIEDPIVGYEATCLMECIAELAFARSDRDANRESRAVMYINTLLSFIRGDLHRAEKKATMQ